MLILLIAVRTPILTRQLPEFLGISRIQCLRRKTDLIRFVHVGSNRTKSKISYAWRFERPIYLCNFILRSLRKIYFLRNPTPPRSGRNTNANTSFTGSARLGHRSRFRLRVQQTPRLLCSKHTPVLDEVKTENPWEPRPPRFHFPIGTFVRVRAGIRPFALDPLHREDARSRNGPFSIWGPSRPCIVSTRPVTLKRNQ